MRRIFAIFAAFLLIAMCGGKAYAEGENAGNDGVSGYVLMEVSTGTVLEEYCPDVPVNIGHLTKLMTLILVAEDLETGKISPDTVLTASQSVSGTKGAVIWLEPGEQITVDELLRGVIIGNANDAALVLAEGCEQSIENFVSRMNSEAFDLGLRSTAFHSPCGYDSDGNTSTAREIAIICRKLASYDNVSKYFKIWRDFVRQGRTELVSENSLTRTYKRHAGFKVCHGEESGYCAAECGISGSGTAFISVVLGAQDGESAEKSAKTLIEHAHSAYRVTPVMFPDEMMKPIPVRSGTESAVLLRIKGQQTAVLPRNSGEPAAVVVLPDYLCAPLRKGQPVGTVAFYDGKNLVCETAIVTAEKVDRLSFNFIARKLMCNVLE